MRIALLVALVFTLPTSNVTQSGGDGHVKAWSGPNGSYGEMWHLAIERDGSARVSSSSELGAKSLERRFTVSLAQHQAILAAAEETEFFSLTKSLGPSSIPIHGPQNTLELDVRGRVHRVFLNDPASAEGAQVKRFRRVWRAVVESSPIKPPL